MRSTIKAKVVLAAVLVVLVAVGVLAYYALRPALKVGSFSLSKKEYQALVAGARADKVKDDEIKDKIINNYKLQEAAKKLGVIYSTQNADDMAAQYYRKSSAELDAWQHLYGQVVAINNVINLKKEGGVEGYYFNYPFARNFAFGYEGAGPDYGKPAAIEADKAYASTQSAADRQQLIDGKVSPDALVAKLQKDVRLTYGGASNGSRYFTYTSSGKWLTFRDGEDRVTPEFVTYLQSLGVGLSPVSSEASSANYSRIKGYDKAGTALAYRFYKIVDVVKPDKAFAAAFNTALGQVKVVAHV